MEKFYTSIALVLLTLILVLTIRKQSGEIATVLALCGCCAVLSVAVAFLSPILNFLERLQSIASLDGEMMKILLKVTGVAFVSEIASMICADAGNTALGKSLQILTVIVILYLSVPMFEALLTLVERILVAA